MELCVAGSAIASSGRSHRSARPLQRVISAAAGASSPPAATNPAPSAATMRVAATATATAANRRGERTRGARTRAGPPISRRLASTPL